MLELLNPSLTSAARAVADIVRFRLEVAASPADRKMKLIAKRFMSPGRRSAEVTVDSLLADLKRFAPDRRQTLGTEAALRPRLAALLAQRQTHYIQQGGQRIACFRWSARGTAAAPTRHALLSHGFESYALSYALVIERLLACGYTVHAFDHAAHGASSGRYSGLPRFAEDLHDVYRHLLAQGIRVDLGVGHSLGAGAWLAVATKLDIHPKRLLLLAPFIDTPELLGSWLKLHGLSADLKPGMKDAIKALHGPSVLDFEDMEIAQLAARLKVPTHIVQDPKDFVAPMRHSKALAQRNAAVRCTAAPEAGHVGVLFAEQALNALQAGG